MTAQADVLDLFNCMVLGGGQLGRMVPPYLGLIDAGVVTDFIPSAEQAGALTMVNEPLPVTTLFSREEREIAPLEHLLTKQLLHYIETYGLNMPGLFDLEVKDGTLVTMTYVKGIKVEELTKKAED